MKFIDIMIILCLCACVCEKPFFFYSMCVSDLAQFSSPAPPFPFYYKFPSESASFVPPPFYFNNVTALLRLQEQTDPSCGGKQCNDIDSPFFMGVHIIGVQSQ